MSRRASNQGRVRRRSSERVLFLHLFLLLPLLLLFAASCPARARGAASPARVTLEQAVRMALDRHPAMESARAGADLARGSLGESRAAYYPTLRYSGSVTRTEDPALVTPIHGFTPGDLPDFDRTVIQNALRLEFPLLDGGGRRARAGAGAERLAAAEAGVEDARQTVTARVVAAYLDVLSRSEILDAHDARLESLRWQRARVLRLQEAGQAAQIEILRVNAAIASAEASRVAEAERLDAAERDLARWISADPDSVRADRLRGVLLADSLPLNRAEWRASADRNPSMLSAARELRAAEAGSRAARSLRWPSLHLIGSFVDWRAPADTHESEWSAAAQISVPIFDGGTIGKGIEKSDASARLAAAQLRSTEKRIHGALDMAISAVEECRASARSLARAEAASAEVVRIERLSLDAGSGTQNDYLAAEAEHLSIRARRIESSHREIAARAELARAAGVLTLEWLDRTLEERP